MHGFDSFVGLPEAWLGDRTNADGSVTASKDGVGAYSQGGRAPLGMPRNVRFHKARFSLSRVPRNIVGRS